MNSPEGFSLLELVVAVAIIGFLLVITAPKLFDNHESQLAMAARMVRADIAAVQRMAVYEGTPIRIEHGENGYSVERVDSGTEVTYGERFPMTGLADDFGVVIETEGTVTFNSLGEPISDSLTSVTLRSVANPALTKRILVEPETGYARLE